MRFCALLIFVGVVALTTADKISRFKREITTRSDFFIRQKRAELFDDMLEPSCEDKCDDTLLTNMNSNSFEGTDNPFSFLSFNTSSLDAVCKVYDTSKSCYAQCSTESTSTSAVYQLMCEDKKTELLKHMPCYQKAKNVSESVCEAKCGVVDAIVNATEETFNSTNTTDFASIEKLMKTMGPLCKFLECAFDCGAEVLTKECPTDPEAVTFFKDMSVAGTTITLKGLNALDAKLGLHLMPSECHALLDLADVKEDGQTQTNGGVLFCPVPVSGTLCPESSTFHYYSCCGDLNNYCCLKLQTWAIVVLAIIGLLIIISSVVAGFTCGLCCRWSLQKG